MVVHPYNLSTQELEEGGSEVRTYPRLHRELEASLGYLSKEKSRWGRKWFELKESLIFFSKYSEGKLM